MSKATYLNELNEAHRIERASRHRDARSPIKTGEMTVGLKSVTPITEE